MHSLLRYCYFSRDLATFALLCFCVTIVVLSVDSVQQMQSTSAGHRYNYPSRNGAGVIIYGNGLGYYAWLRSLLIDRDISFENEFDEYNISDSYLPPRTYVTTLGRRANQWSVGPALAWAPAVAIAHVSLTVGDPNARFWPNDGYSLPYQLAVGGSSVCFSVAGIWLLWRICCKFACRAKAAQTVAFIVFGTTIIYYYAVELSMAHGLGTTLLAAVIYYWLTTYGSRRLSRWLFMGCLLGAVALVRWQLATYVVLPLGEAVLLWRRVSVREILCQLVGLCQRVAILGVGAIITFSPQLACWRRLYGNWLVQPIPDVKAHWLHPSLWDMFLSQDRSLLYWTPLAGIAILAALWSCFIETSGCSNYTSEPENDRTDRLRLLTFAFALQVYILASMWGRGKFLRETGNYAGVFLGNSFGFRDLTESLVVLAPGFARFMDSIRSPFYGTLVGVGYTLIFWNLLVLTQVTHGMLSTTAGADMRTLVTNAWSLLQTPPLAFIASVEALFVSAILLTGTSDRRVRSVLT